MPSLDPSNWNSFIDKQPSSHLLQTLEWGQLKAAFGWQVEHVQQGSVGAQVLFRSLPLGFTFAYLPKGPVASRFPGHQFWEAVDSLCRSKRAVFLKVEPDGWQEQLDGTQISNAGFLLSPQHIQPHATLVIDLHGSEGDVFNRMKPKTRYNIRLAGRKDVIVHPTTDVGAFHRLMVVTGQREQFHVHSQSYYQRAYDLFHPLGKCELFMAECHGQPLASLMVFTHNRRGYYFYGASSNEQRHLKSTYPLQWEAIRWAHAGGCVEYDMWGIPDDAADAAGDESDVRDDGLWGVYRFKRGFGGTIRHSPPTLDRVYSPLLYRLYLWRLAGSGTD
jgi:peptidoglycan pentaglycine glycine transferase (the first glycine)